METRIPEHRVGTRPDSDLIGRNRIRLVVDDREARCAVVEALSQIPLVKLEVRRLKVGDYEVGGEWTFERKSVADFAASLFDGRLFRQAARLGRCPGGRALILEGCEAELGARSNLSREAFQGAMLSLGLAFHIPVLRSLDPGETARLLVFAGNQAARRHELAVSPRPGRRPRSVERQRLWILLGLPGIGAHRARALLTRFGSVQAVMTAGEGELAATSGIGAVTARRLRALIAPPTGSGPAPEAATTEARESRGCESRR